MAGFEIKTHNQTKRARQKHTESSFCKAFSIHFSNKRHGNLVKTDLEP